MYSSRFLDRFERLFAEATFRTPAHKAKMYSSARRVTWGGVGDRIAKAHLFLSLGHLEVLLIST